MTISNIPARITLATLAALVLAALAPAGAVLTSSATATDARHYEKVSPADKGQGDIVGDGETTIAGVSGDAVAFNSRTPFGDTIGSGVSGQTQYVARRSADGGWVTHAVTPTGRPDAVQTFLAATKMQTFSDDLRTAVVWGYDLPGVTGTTPLRNNIYVEDTATRGLRPVTVSSVAPLFFGDFVTQTVWGISGDAHHVAFVTSTQLLSDATLGVPNVYQWDDGRLSVAGKLMDDHAPAGGSDVSPANYREAMSKDGSRLLFTAASPTGGSSQLYMRIGDARTVWVSKPEGTDQSDPANVVMQAMTPDGHSVFFVSDSSLLDDDVSPGPDIYRYTERADPVTGRHLTLITHNGVAAYDNTFGGTVVGVSDDGTRVYYHTSTDTVAVWNDGTTRVISASVPRDSIPQRQLAALASAPGFGRVTPDGSYLAFITAALAGTDQMYLYSLRDDRFTCVSCPTSGPAGNVTVTPTVTSGSVGINDLAIRPRFLSDKGQVFFSTPEALLPQDRNGVVDAYEYDGATGTLSLLSPGTGSTPTSFADASASGDDVFLLTRQRLAGTDHDDLVDMYDARVGPPLPEQPATTVAQCDGEGCQSPPSPSPAEAGIGSLGLDESEPAPTSRAFTVARQVTVTGATGRVRVQLLGAGRLGWRGTGLQSSSIKRDRAGTYQLQLRLTKHAGAQLAKKRSYTTTVRLTFTRLDGIKATGSTRVTFRAAARKGR